MSTDTLKLAGYYGKLPLRGDFIQRNLDSEFIQYWDQWLQSVIGTSRESLGEQWLELYLVSPIWRFYIQINRNIHFCGIMLPSVDKVGRYFPFVIANQVDQNTHFPQDFQKNQQWFNLAENLALQALDENITLDDLNYGIDNLNLHSMTTHSASTVPTNNFRIPLNPQTTLNDAFNQAVQFLPHSTPQTPNYWWTSGNEQIPGNLIACDKMPDDNMYIAMLDGRWNLCHLQTIGQSSHDAIPDNLDTFI